MSGHTCYRQDDWVQEKTQLNNQSINLKKQLGEKGFSFGATSNSTGSTTSSTTSVIVKPLTDLGNKLGLDPSALLTSVAQTCGIDASTLQSNLNSGQSLLEVAESHGIDKQQLVQSITN
ncbi:hypothetical protein NZD89_19860 [Alicyclobacillus fastidiosus]|uniref:LysM domain-containing protein n=1 Tax=Alicyclobacillus fastidiosus TaxID=392011 RepID=A0ABY6ZDF8_9BACL|nr:hypothetical protein [Alicyclobacillus fastidiosus]WAH40552.1 hypothetical protein NZD89_19860 [Alicyclobacillus fastidiosus]GMA61985.1 hypothetical protein GCM10025859_24250 [Alicyclobacillus fastidiosus]